MTVGNAHRKHTEIKPKTNQERRFPIFSGKTSHTPVITASRPPNLNSEFVVREYLMDLVGVFIVFIYRAVDAESEKHEKE